MPQNLLPSGSSFFPCIESVWTGLQSRRGSLGHVRVGASDPAALRVGCLWRWAGKGRWLCPGAVGSAGAALDLWKHKSLPFPVMLVLLLLCSQEDSEDSLSENCRSSRVPGSSVAQGVVSAIVTDTNHR